MQFNECLVAMTTFDRGLQIPHFLYIFHNFFRLKFASMNTTWREIKEIMKAFIDSYGIVFCILLDYTCTSLINKFMVKICWRIKTFSYGSHHYRNIEWEGGGCVQTTLNAYIFKQVSIRQRTVCLVDISLLWRSVHHINRELTKVNQKL